MRSVCDDRVGTMGWPEGTVITIEHARPDYPGWVWVTGSSPAGSSWVREEYLSASQPVEPTPRPAAATLPTLAPPPAPTAAPSAPAESGGVTSDGAPAPAPDVTPMVRSAMPATPTVRASVARTTTPRTAAAPPTPPRRPSGPERRPESPALTPELSLQAVTLVSEPEGDRVIVDHSGTRYRIEKGPYCRSVGHYVGQTIFILSADIFAGAGSSLILPNGEACQILTSERL